MWTTDPLVAALVVLLGGVGTYLMLPYRRPRTRPTYGAGALAAAAALTAFVFFWSPPGPFLATVFFYLFSVAAIAAALLVVTSRNPIHSALWFASVVLATSGLFLLAGAPFLAAGTVIVYAGAIVVTFLFVIMLAQLEGIAPYDRAARAPGRATLTCFLLLWCLIFSLTAIKPTSAQAPASHAEQVMAEADLSRLGDLTQRIHLERAGGVSSVVALARTSTSQTRDARGSEKPNVVGLGASLYTDHLISAGLAGALLFVALIGAVAISNPKPAERPGAAGASSVRYR
jgi:NADH-quinone oxidoreductase subunit J